MLRKITFIIGLFIGQSLKPVTNFQLLENLTAFCQQRVFDIGQEGPICIFQVVHELGTQIQLLRDTMALQELNFLNRQDDGFYTFGQITRDEFDRLSRETLLLVYISLQINIHHQHIINLPEPLRIYAAEAFYLKLNPTEAEQAIFDGQVFVRRLNRFCLFGAPLEIAIPGTPVMALPVGPAAALEPSPEIRPPHDPRRRPSRSRSLSRSAAQPSPEPRNPEVRNAVIAQMRGEAPSAAEVIRSTTGPSEAYQP